MGARKKNEKRIKRRQGDAWRGRDREERRQRDIKSQTTEKGANKARDNKRKGRGRRSGRGSDTTEKVTRRETAKRVKKAE